MLHIDIRLGTFHSPHLLNFIFIRTDFLPFTVMLIVFAGTAWWTVASWAF